MQHHSKKMCTDFSAKGISLLVIFVLIMNVFIFHSCKKDDNIPSSIDNFAVQQQGTCLLFSWNGIKGADIYVIYYSPSESVLENMNYAAYNGPGGVVSNNYGISYGIWEYITQTNFSICQSDVGYSLSDNFKNTCTDFQGNGLMYFVVVYNNNSGQFSKSNIISTNISSSNSGSGGGTTTTLSPPASISATQSGSSVNISWSAVSGATSYFVYRSNTATGTYSSLTSAPGTSATDASPLSGYNYYKVKASNGTTTSDYSNYASCNFSGGTGGGTGGGGTSTPPNAPSGGTVTNTGSTLLPYIQISWNSVSGATSYKIYRSCSSSSGFVLLGTTTNTVYADANPLTGYNYYRVSAVNNSGESAQSSVGYYNNDQANAVAPCPVTYGNCTVSGTTITMRWTVSTALGCGTPTTAYLKVKDAGDNNYVVLQTLSGTATSASFNYTPYIGTMQFSVGYIYVGIILENAAGTSGGIPKVYDTVTKTWIL